MPLEVNFNLDKYPMQKAFILDMTTNTAFVGGRGSGKTFGGAIKAFLLCYQYPGLRGLVTAPIYKTLSGSTVPAYQGVFPQEISEFHKGEFKLTTQQGNEIFFRSTDDPDSLRGYDVGFLHMDEARGSPLEAWQMAKPTVRQAGMPCLSWVTTTPAGYNWIYQEFGISHPKEGYKGYFVSSRDNPWLPEGYLTELEKLYSAAQAEQEIEGRFMASMGCYFDIEVLTGLLAGAKSGETFKPYVMGRRYAAAIDPAGEGVGPTASASSLSILDCQTGEYVVDYTSLEPLEEYAYKAYGLLGKYQSPLLQIEPNGVGLNMIRLLKDLGYTRFVYADEERTRIGKPASETQRTMMLVDLEMGLRQGALIVYSRATLDEMFSFEKREKGSPRAALGARDDRVLSVAWARWVAGQQPKYSVLERPRRVLSYGRA